MLFDLDGTLIDSIRLIIDSYHHTLATHGLPPRTDADWLRGIGTPLRVQFAEWSEHPGLEAMIATYRDYNLANHDACVTPYPGITDAVRRVREAGLRTGLVTSKYRPGAERGLRLCELESLMEVIVGADDVVNPKPHPEPVELALRLLGAVHPGRSRAHRAGLLAGTPRRPARPHPLARISLARSSGPGGAGSVLTLYLPPGPVPRMFSDAPPAAR